MRAAIFDIDGTLLLSNEQHARAWSDALQSGGHDVSVERILPLIGMAADRLLPELGIDADSDEGKRLSDAHGENFHRLLPTCRPAAGARDLVAALKQRGFQLAVATSSDAADVALLLQQANVDPAWFDVVASVDDAESSKPSPDIVSAAMKKLGVGAHEAVLFGDTPYDVEAATRAGIFCVAFRCGGHDDDDLGGALAVFDAPSDVVKRIDLLLPSARAIDATL